MRKLLDVTPPAGRPYPVLLGRDGAAGLSQVWQPSWRQVALVADHHTDALFGDAVCAALERLECTVSRQVFRAGEERKTRNTKAAIEDAMVAASIDRSGCLVALGGGVVLDVGGFVAATYMRGIAHVAIATSLLAQVDAAVGGKTAVNSPLGKNLIGAFHHPRAVLLDLTALEHLPEVELRAGLAEAIKHAVIGDEVLFALIEAWAERGESLIPPEEVIDRCVALKAQVVAEDDRDAGRRHILNFGHTVAHAIEHASDHAVSHGEAVAAGMMVEAGAAVELGRFPRADLERLERLLARLRLPTAPQCDFAAARRFFARDKKTEAGVARCALPQHIGQSAPVEGSWLTAIGLDVFERAWGPRR